MPLSIGMRHTCAPVFQFQIMSWSGGGDGDALVDPLLLLVVGFDMVGHWMTTVPK
jgi:hypothetical protein